LWKNTSPAKITSFFFPEHRWTKILLQPDLYKITANTNKIKSMFSMNKHEEVTIV
jgi:hypothetical protein